jgi:hypothetical protein
VRVTFRTAVAPGKALLEPTERLAVPTANAGADSANRTKNKSFKCLIKKSISIPPLSAAPLVFQGFDGI